MISSHCRIAPPRVRGGASRIHRTGDFVGVLALGLACAAVTTSHPAAAQEKPYDKDRDKAAALQKPVQQQILYINSYDPYMEWTQNIRQAIDKRYPGSKVSQFDLWAKAFDSPLREGAKGTQLESFLMLLKEAHKPWLTGQKWDLVFATDDPALKLLFEMPDVKEELLGKDTPVVFGGVNDSENTPTSVVSAKSAGRRQELMIMGERESPPVADNLRLIKRLHPDLDRLVVINDATVTGRAWRNRIKEVIDTDPELKLRFAHCTTYTGHDTWRSLAFNLRDWRDVSRMVVLLGAFNNDTQKQVTSYAQATRAVVNEVNPPNSMVGPHPGSRYGLVPVYGMLRMHLANGAWAGKVLDGYEVANGMFRIADGLMEEPDPGARRAWIQAHDTADFREMGKFYFGKDVPSSMHDTIYAGMVALEPGLTKVAVGCPVPQAPWPAWVSALAWAAAGLGLYYLLLAAAGWFWPGCLISYAALLDRLNAGPSTFVGNLMATRTLPSFVTVGLQLLCHPHGKRLLLPRFIYWSTRRMKWWLDRHGAALTARYEANKLIQRYRELQSSGRLFDVPCRLVREYAASSGDTSGGQEVNDWGSLAVESSSQRPLIYVHGRGGSGKSVFAVHLQQEILRGAKDRGLPCAPIIIDRALRTEDPETALKKLVQDLAQPQVQGNTASSAVVISCDWLGCLLLRRGIVILVDGLSEMDAAFQAAFAALACRYPQALGSIVVSSRLRPEHDARFLYNVLPLSLNKHLPEFTLKHLESRGWDDYAKRVARMAEVLQTHFTHPRYKHTGILFATLMIEDALDGGNRVFDGSLIEMVKEHVRKVICGDVVPSASQRLQYARTLDLFTLLAKSTLFAAPRFHAKDISPEIVFEVFSNPADICHLERLVSSGLLEEPEKDGSQSYRFGVDPIAEYLAIDGYFDEPAAAGAPGTVERWRSLTDEVAGDVDALALAGTGEGRSPLFPLRGIMAALYDRWMSDSRINRLALPDLHQKEWCDRFAKADIQVGA